jgi:hypothetical protein
MVEIRQIGMLEKQLNGGAQLAQLGRRVGFPPVTIRNMIDIDSGTTHEASSSKNRWFML